MEHSADHARSDTIDADTASARDVDKILALLKRALSNTSLTDDYASSPIWDGRAPTVGEDDENAESSVEDFKSFEQRVLILDQELLSFTNAVRQLGSSIGLTTSAKAIRSSLGDVRTLFQENVDRLVGNNSNQTTQERKASIPLSSGPRRLPRRRRTSHTRYPSNVIMDVDQIPGKLYQLANELEKFGRYLREIAEFSDEAVDISLKQFEGDLKYWSSSLSDDFRGQLREPDVRQFINDLTEEMADHLDTLIDALKRYREVGVPTIQSTQQRQASALQNLSTVATFFSAVNATTIQYSYNLDDTHLSRSTNLLWILSLVFSIASAINSQIANHWRSAGYRSPAPHVPKIVALWMTHTPLLLLGISVIAFSSGLICFTFQVFSHHFFIPLITCVCTSVTSFALITVGLWLAGERYAATRTKKKVWLSLLLSRKAGYVADFTGLTFVRRWLTDPPPSSHRARFAAFRRRVRYRISEIKETTLSLLRIRPRVRGLPRPRLTVQTGAFPSSPMGSTLPTLDTLERGTHGLHDSPPRMASDLPQSPSLDPTRLSPTEPYAPRSFIGLSLRSAAAAVLLTTVRGMRPESYHPAAVPMEETQEEEEITPAQRVLAIAPLIRGLRVTRSAQGHSAFIRHLQFSHDGRYLATCSWDKLIIVWRVGPPFEIFKALPHPRGGRVNGLSWSRNGSLVARSFRTIQIWNVERAECQMVERNHEVQFVKWMPLQQAFLSLEDDGKVHIVPVNSSGTSLEATDLDFDRLRVHSVDVTADEKWLVAVATVLSTKSGERPTKSRPERRIVVYDMRTRTIKRQIPGLASVQDIALSHDDSYALVSFDDDLPPRLYEVLRSRTIPLRLRLVRKFVPRTSAPQFKYAGPSILGSVRDTSGRAGHSHLVLSASKEGEVIVWDAETGTQVHSFHAERGSRHPLASSSLMGIACNPSAPAHACLMLAASCLDGSVMLLESPGMSGAPADRVEVAADGQDNMASQRESVIGLTGMLPEQSSS